MNSDERALERARNLRLLTIILGDFSAFLVMGYHRKIQSDGGLFFYPQPGIARSSTPKYAI